KRLEATGIATPLVRTELRSPDPGQIVTTPITFQFASVRGSVQSVVIQYVIQLSTDPSFPGNSQTVTLTPFLDLVTQGGQTVSSPTIDTSTFFPGAPQVYWRVGARNIDDSPGPVPDASGQRYVFSGPSLFKRAGFPGGSPGGG
ncbi:MAG TPA: hypothetical protein VNI20_02415, partial [Fimbriimonadaceae bacterium]|nr:hypothetical protein [Fimbriimonadaceae bacterium]